MKTVNFFNNALLAFSLIVFTQSCSSANEEFVYNSEEEAIVVSLSPDGGTATKATDSYDIYGINVYVDKDKDGECETPYAYGLFDNKDNMTLTLYNNNTYKFVCTLVKDGGHSLYRGSSGFAYPFQTSSSVTSSLTNAFAYSDAVYFTGLSSGSAHLSTLTATPTATNATKFAPVDRYYGETDGFKATATQKRVTINLKRTVFGAKYVISGMVEGTSLNVKSPFGWDFTATTNCSGSEEIFSFDDLYTCWKNESDYTAQVTLTYSGGTGSFNSISQYPKVTFKRNYLTTVQINAGVSSFSLKEEPMNTKYIDLGLNTNGSVDVVVNPNEEQ